MMNAWRLFTGDLKRLAMNTVTVIIVLGLVALPSLFSWYNLLASWSVFDNTGNLTVAVANSDEGFESDLVPIRINIGDQVVSTLRENDQLNWVFTDEADAIDGARSGRYYAAVVIPPSFSADMLSFYSEDVEHATIDYYANQKKSAIAPKVTDQGADRVSAEVNRAFTQTLSQTAFALATAVADYADDADAEGRIGAVAEHLAQTAGQLDDVAGVLRSYSALLQTARSIADSADSLLAQAGSEADEVAQAVAPAREGASSVADALSQSADALGSAVATSEQAYASVPTAIDSAFDAAGAAASDSSAQLRSAAASASSQADNYRDLADQLQALADSASDGAVALGQAASLAGSAAQAQDDLADALGQAADAIDTNSHDAEAKRAEAKRLAQQAAEAVGAVRTEYDEQVAPLLAGIAESTTQAAEGVESGRLALADARADVATGRDSAAARLDQARKRLDDAALDLESAADDLRSLSEAIATALAQNDPEALRAVIGSDPATFAEVIAAPVELERHAVYPVENFGSAMAPLYTTLALWIGALLTMVALRITPSERTLKELDDPTPRQVFVGRFGVVAFINLMQSTLVCLGNLLFLGVQAVHPLLYLLCFWVSGLTFAFIIYTLVATFGNLGKALSVVLLIVQVSGGGGSFPLPLLPSFFQRLSPFLPITHAVDAMRAAMFGIYHADFWVQMGELLLFAVPFVVIGLVLGGPISRVVARFVERVEASKVM